MSIHEIHDIMPRFSENLYNMYIPDCVIVYSVCEIYV